MIEDINGDADALNENHCRATWEDKSKRTECSISILLGNFQIDDQLVHLI